MSTIRQQRNMLQILEDHEHGLRRMRQTLARIGNVDFTAIPSPAAVQGDGTTTHATLRWQMTDVLDHWQWRHSYTTEDFILERSEDGDGPWDEWLRMDLSADDIVFAKDIEVPYIIIDQVGATGQGQIRTGAWTGKDNEWYTYWSGGPGTGARGLYSFFGNGSDILDVFMDGHLDIDGDFSAGGGGTLNTELLIENTATSGGQIRLRHSTNVEEVLLRHDGNNFYILTTDSQGGSWDTTRPLQIDTGTGIVTMQEGLVLSDVANLTISSGGNIDWTSGEITIKKAGVNRFISTASYSQICDTAGTTKFWVGNTAVYQNATTHYWRDTASAAKMTLNSSGNLLLYGTNLYFEYGVQTNHYIVGDGTQYRFMIAGTEEAQIDANGIHSANRRFYFGSGGSNDYIAHNDSLHEFQLWEDGVNFITFDRIGSAATLHLQNQSNGQLRVSNDNGYGDFGSINSSFLHVYTDRAQFAINKDLRFIGAYGIEHDTLPSYDNSFGSIRWQGLNLPYRQAHTSSSMATKKNVQKIRTRGQGQPDATTGAVFDRLDPVFFEYADDHPYRDRWRGRKLKSGSEPIGEEVDSTGVPSPVYADEDYIEWDSWDFETPAIGRMGFSYEQMKEVAPHWAYEADGMPAVSYEGMLPDFMAWAVATIQDMRARIDALEAA